MSEYIVKRQRLRSPPRLQTTEDRREFAPTPIPTHERSRSSSRSPRRGRRDLSPTVRKRSRSRSPVRGDHLGTTHVRHESKTTVDEDTFDIKNPPMMIMLPKACTNLQDRRGDIDKFSRSQKDRSEDRQQRIHKTYLQKLEIQQPNHPSTKSTTLASPKPVVTSQLKQSPFYVAF